MNQGGKKINSIIKNSIIKISILKIMKIKDFQDAKNLRFLCIKN